MKNVDGIMHFKGHPARRVFWDTEYREPPVSSRPLTAEEKLAAALLIQAIQYHKGVSPDGNKECVECHQEEHPSCFKFLKRSGEDYVLRINKQCRDYHTRSECATRWIASDDAGERDGAGWTFIGLCEILGIAPSYLRRTLRNAEFEAYWKDEAKINSFLDRHS